MASFKLCISDPSSGKTFQREVKDNQAKPFIGLNIGEPVKGDSFDFAGYEFMITGGSDYCGFPMRRGILGLRKKISIFGGVGYRGGPKGIKERKTVCGHKIYEKTSQINLKVTKHGSKKLAEIFGVAEEPKKEAKEGKAEHKEAKEHKEEKPEAKEHKHEEKKEAKDEKPEHKAKEHKEEKKEAKEEKPKAEEKKE